jgi:drug/metabolite transporter (DMT)-like permease
MKNKSYTKLLMITLSVLCIVFYIISKYLVIYHHEENSNFFFSLAFVFNTVPLIYVLKEVFRSDKKNRITWLFALLFLNFLAVLLYLIFDNRRNTNYNEFSNSKPKFNFS